MRAAGAVSRALRRAAAGGGAAAAGAGAAGPAACAPRVCAPVAGAAAWRHAGGGPPGGTERARWEWLQAQGHTVNPCHSALHPAAEAGIAPEGDTELSVQARGQWGAGGLGA
jgi:hypothetical protein